MKIRQSFVSNSSSSSYIIIGDISVLPQGFQFAKLNKKQKLIVKKRIPELDLMETVYLTEFISDSCDINWAYENNSAEYKKNVIEYLDGSHGGPYNEDDYNEIENNVWLLKKEHYEN